MTIESLTNQIRLLETQLALLKTQLEKMTGAGARKPFGALHGAFTGHGTVSEAELEEAKYGFNWNGMVEG